MGAYLTPAGPLMATLNIGKNSVGMYQTPLVEVQTRCAVTNTAPIGAYRGAGRPEGNYLMERLIDKAARGMGIDKASLRRRNLIRPRGCPGRRRWARSMTAAISRRCSSGRSKPPIGRAMPATEAEPEGRFAARARHRLLSRGHGATHQ
jgi:CO/xanthine dehydrogenase Mo-binding subunit